MNMKRSDLVTIIAIVAVLLLLGLVAMNQLQRARGVAPRIHCISNMKQIGLGFLLLANDNDGLNPMNAGYTDSTIRDDALTGRLVRIFQVMSNEMSVPRTIICPADNRLPAMDWSSLSNSNISYFVGLDAEATRPNMAASGDRNIAIDGKLLSGVVALGTNSAVTWTRAIHRDAGNLALADGSAQQVTSPLLRRQLKNSGDATNLLVFPQ
jgi:hypothetical protein